MTALKKVTDMQAQGVPEDKIISELQSQGISPNEITEALNQAQIKNAITNTEQMDEQQLPQMNEDLGAPSEEVYTPQPQEYAEENYDAPQQDYGQQGYAPAGGSDTSTIIEISEQVFMEKIKKTEKKLNEVLEFKTLSETKIENIDNRLKRIETMIDKLQIEILQEVGSYGKDLDRVKKEVNMIEDSFSKVAKHKKTSKK
jgi:DNA-binding transcriptional MerR regulator